MGERIVSRFLVSKRLHRGWSMERAEKVVPLPRVRKGTVYDISKYNMRNVREIVCQSFEENKPVVTCWCKCGEPFVIKASEVLQDISCGCDDHCNLETLEEIRAMENDIIFLNVYCPIRNVPSTLRNYRIYKAK